MKRPLALVSAVLVGSLLVTQIPRVSSQDESGKVAADVKAKRPLLPASSGSLRRLMSEKIDVPPELRQQPVPLKIVLNYIVESAAARNVTVPIDINRAAFREAGAEANLLDENIEFPVFVGSMTYRHALESIASQLPGNATFLIREGLLVITPTEHARIERLLDRKMVIEFFEKPLGDALGELSDRAGLSIVVDPACDLKKRIELNAAGDISVRGILDSIADVNDLKVLVTDRRVMVMPQSVYMKRLRSQLEESKLLHDIEMIPSAARPQIVPTGPEGRAAQ